MNCPSGEIRVTIPTDGVMQEVTGEHQAVPPDLDSAAESAGDGARGTGGPVLRLNPSLAALITWIVCLPVAYVAARIGPADPFRLRVAMVPVVVLVAGVAVAGLVSRRLPADLASGIGAGLAGGWVAYTLRAALHGTPYPFGGLASDAGRMADMANRYASTWHSADGIVPSVPSNYPPLFPWLVGRTSAVTHVAAWRLLGPAEAITLSFAVVAGYLLWRYLAPGPVALALSLPVLLCFSLPEKAYEILALAIFIPWAIATFGDPPRGRLHWLPAGLIGGLSILLYWAFIMFAALGVLALAVLAWRASPDRVKYVRHVVLTVVVALVVASWYLIPYLGWGFLHGSSQVEYQYQGGGIQDSPLSFLSPTPLGVLQLIGVIGLLWWRGRVWWGKPLLLLSAGIYGYWLLGLASFVLANHHLLLQDTPRLNSLVLASAGVLTITQAAPAIVRKISIRTVPAGLPALALCLLVIWVAFTAWQAWMPGGPASATGLYQPAVTSQPNDTTAAFTTALPDGSYSPATPVSIRGAWFPIDPIENDVASVLGNSAEPVTLSASEQLFAFVNWPGYIGVTWGAAGIDTDWPARYAALSKLSRVTDPAAFTTASARTAFGPVDVFILHRASPARWTWAPAGSPDPAISFTPAQFGPHAFTVFTNLPDGYVLAVRQPQGNG
jgi:Arabinofuranosyltransferase N terminal